MQNNTKANAAANIKRCGSALWFAGMIAWMSDEIGLLPLGLTKSSAFRLLSFFSISSIALLIVGFLIEYREGRLKKRS